MKRKFLEKESVQVERDLLSEKRHLRIMSLLFKHLHACLGRSRNAGAFGRDVRPKRPDVRGVYVTSTSSLPSRFDGEALPDAQNAAPQEHEAARFADGELKLIDVDEKTAALIMAIVSDQSGIPLSQLRFQSIRLMK
jgi:hypothetical protein